MNCDHKDCRCQEAVVELAGKHFCSERCAEEETSGRAGAKNGCGCGHPDCAAV